MSNVLPEIILPEAKPALEWVRGRVLQKVSPKYRHARLQRTLGTLLGEWGEGKGRVGSEWRFRVAPPAERRRPLVPDVAYLSYARLPLEADDEAQEPAMAPEVALEILSPGDRRVDIDDKIATYLAAGARLVVVVDPEHETIEAHDAQGIGVTPRGTVFTHDALPGFTLDTEALFADARR